MHLEGYRFSQEKCHHIGDLHYFSNHTLVVSKSTDESGNKRRPFPYDCVICSDCGITLQLLWTEREAAGAN